MVDCGGGRRSDTPSFIRSVGSRAVTAKTAGAVTIVLVMFLARLALAANDAVTAVAAGAVAQAPWWREIILAVITIGGSVVAAWFASGGRYKTEMRKTQDERCAQHREELALHREELSRYRAELSHTREELANLRGQLT